MARPDRIREKEGLPALGEGVSRTIERGDKSPDSREGEGDPPARRETLSLREGKIDRQRATRAPLDDGQGNGQSSRSSPTAEGELELSRKVARRLKWTDREEWVAAGRDPAKWVDADVYLERTPQEVDRLRDTLTRTGQVAERALAQEREAARRDAETRLRKAVADGNEDEAMAASREVATANAPDPRTLAWVGRNPWFNSDPVAQSVAAAVVKRKANEGASHEDQLQAAEEEVKRRFPEHRGRDEGDGGRETRQDDRRDTRDLPASEGREARLSEVRRAPAVQEGSRTLGGARQQERVQGWNDVPDDAKAQMKAFEKAFIRRGMSQTEARQQLATGYFENLGN